MSSSNPWWYGKPVPTGSIQGKILTDGQRIVPKFFVDVHAYLHRYVNDSNEEVPCVSWILAELWFRDRGWTVVSNEEWDSYRSSTLHRGVTYWYKFPGC